MSKTPQRIVLVIHDVRSTHNVGSLLRTADGFGINMVYLTGYTPYPKKEADERLPHLADKITRQIHKTALGAEDTQAWETSSDINFILGQLKQAGYSILALEQSPKSKKLANYRPSEKVVLVVGNEVEGIDDKTLAQCDEILEIPMHGKKESFNVAVATAVALYHLKNY